MRKKNPISTNLNRSLTGFFMILLIAVTAAANEPPAEDPDPKADSQQEQPQTPAAVLAKMEMRKNNAGNAGGGSEKPSGENGASAEEDGMETKSGVGPITVIDEDEVDSEEKDDDSNDKSNNNGKTKKKKAHDDLPPIELTEEALKLAQEKIKLELEYALKVQTLKNELSDLDLKRQRQEVEMKAAEVEQKVKLQQLVLAGERLKKQTEAEVIKLETQREKLEAGIALEKTELQKDLNAVRAETERLRAEKEKLAAQMDVEKSAQEAELAKLQLEKEKVAAGLELARLEHQKDLAQIEADKNKLQQQVAMLEQQVALTTAEAKAQIFDEKLAENPEYHRSLAESELFTTQVAARTAELEATNLQSQIQQKLVENETTLMDHEILRQKQREDYEEFVYTEIEYSEDPLAEGILKITDRRIPLNGVIRMATADYVTSNIDYYNNKDPRYPIFIVIDNCPGGSVMAGYRILKSMEGSQAPVYVVVKSYAASMAATIATLAPRSFAYPNAIIHHHQMLFSSRGNMTQQKEMLDEMQEWWDRLATPVAEKMGITLEEFVERMYEQNVDGEWTEFASEAKQLNWIDHVITEIQEVGTKQRPAEEAPPAFPWFALTEETDAKGAQYVQLPRLDPFDAWYLHNPDGYYRY